MMNGLQEGLYHFWHAFTDGTFQLVSSMTSSGFYNTNYDLWPYEMQVLMLIVMFVGGMSGSTAGGIKIIRHILLVLITKSRLELFYRPESVRSLKVSGKEIDSNIAINVFCFFFLIISISVLGTFLYSVDGVDPETSIGLTSSMINNVGFAFRQAGAMNSFIILSFDVSWTP
jgi:trk system potassium uptake protein TrkH